MTDGQTPTATHAHTQTNTRTTKAIRRQTAIDILNDRITYANTHNQSDTQTGS